MSDLGLIERSTIDGMVDQVKRLAGIEEDITPKEALGVFEDLELGAVKTVNGLEPDENGDIFLDLENALASVLISFGMAPVILDSDGVVLVDSDDAILITY